MLKRSSASSDFLSQYRCVLDRILSLSVLLDVSNAVLWPMVLCEPLRYSLMFNPATELKEVSMGFT